jgi:hypothetical protein
MKKLLFLTLFLIITVSLFGQKRINKEIYYQNYFAEKINGQTEFVLFDRTRVDILTSEYAIEVDFANKWAEGIGQSLYYSLVTEKKAGVLLIMEYPEKDKKYLNRLIKVSNKYNIKIWTIDSDNIIKEL